MNFLSVAVRSQRRLLATSRDAALGAYGSKGTRGSGQSLIGGKSRGTGALTVEQRAQLEAGELEVDMELEAGDVLMEVLAEDHRCVASGRRNPPSLPPAPVVPLAVLRAEPARRPARACGAGSSATLSMSHSLARRHQTRMRRRTVRRARARYWRDRAWRTASI